MITKMKKLTFLIYHKEYEQFLQSIRDLGVVHVAEKAQGTAENTELQESIRLSNRYASTIKFLQSLNVELKEQKGDAARGEKALEEVGLKSRMNHQPNQLSGGQQQRVAIARALANNPTILLADEPTGALDRATGRQVMSLFHDLNDEGRTIIMITHDIEIARHARRIVRILDGEISEGVVEDA